MLSNSLIRLRINQRELEALFRSLFQVFVSFQHGFEQVGRHAIKRVFVAIEDCNRETLAGGDGAHRVAFQFGDAGDSVGENLMAHGNIQAQSKVSLNVP